MHLPSSQSQHVAFCVARQPWHHASLMRWRRGNTVHCLLKEYYSSPQRENTKKQKKYEIWNMYEICLGSGQRANADVHPCTFEREVIWASSRLAFERAFYPMTYYVTFRLVSFILTSIHNNFDWKWCIMAFWNWLDSTFQPFSCFMFSVVTKSRLTEEAQT